MSGLGGALVMLGFSLFFGITIVCNVFSLGTEWFPFNDPTLPWHTRVEDLVGRLTVAEISQQMASGGRTTHAPAIPRLGIPPYSWGVECLRGDIKAGPATSFPQALGLSATFSPEVIFNVSRATGLEVRAKFNNYSSHGYYGEHSGASCWSPVINIMRDPRWGRNQETYGEDPYMSGVLAEAFVHGLQGDNPRYIMANAGCKHYDAYGGPENIPVSRHSFDAKVSESNLRMTFFPAFKRCVEAGTYSIMCSYNSVNGIPACANKMLLTDVLRKEWGFEGYVISDEGAIEDIMLNHKYTKSVTDTAAAAVNAGTNLEDGPRKSAPFFSTIAAAVHAGKLTEATIREAVKPLFYTRMRLGLFDPPSMNPYSKLTVKDVVQNAAHRELSLATAMRSFVLLKNINNFLPLDKDTQFNKLAIVGPMADNIPGMFGGYPPEPDPKYITTPLKGLKGLGKAVQYHPGCEHSDTRCISYNADAIEKAVKNANAVIVCLGTGANIEDESTDRADLLLPGKQLQLLKDAVANTNSDVPVILLLFNAGPLDISWAVDNPRVTIIMECFFPAQATGEALMKVLLREGHLANPAGRLPATWPAYLHQYPPITDYTMVNRTYRYFSGDPMYPFGYGLSYSNFKYRNVSIVTSTLNHTVDSHFTVNVHVTNDGPFDGEEVIQVYAAWPYRSQVSVPKLQLIGFQRRMIGVHQTVMVSFTVQVQQLAIWDESKHEWIDLLGRYTIYVGGQQPNQKRKVNSNVLQTDLLIT